MSRHAETWSHRASENFRRASCKTWLETVTPPRATCLQQFHGGVGPPKHPKRLNSSTMSLLAARFSNPPTRSLCNVRTLAPNLVRSGRSNPARESLTLADAERNQVPDQVHLPCHADVTLRQTPCQIRVANHRRFNALCCRAEKKLDRKRHQSSLSDKRERRPTSGLSPPSSAWTSHPTRSASPRTKNQGDRHLRITPQPSRTRSQAPTPAPSSDALASARSASPVLFFWRAHGRCRLSGSS